MKKSDTVSYCAYIIVNRKSQKAMLIRKNGAAVKELGSRESIETFIGKQVSLDLHVKVREKRRTG